MNAAPCMGARDERCHPESGMCACFDAPKCNGNCWAKWVDPACPKHGTAQGNK